MTILYYQTCWVQAIMLGEMHVKNLNKPNRVNHLFWPPSPHFWAKNAMI
jgi:hypothetical protein